MTLVQQAAAVLGVVRVVAGLERTARWVPEGQQLVLPELASEAFGEIAALLAFPKTGFVQTATEIAPQAVDQDASACRGLLLWLAHRGGLDWWARDSDDIEEVVENRRLRASLAMVAAQVACDPAAKRLAWEAIEGTVPFRKAEARRWFAGMVEWGTALRPALREDAARAGRDTRCVEPGDVVRVKAPGEPPLIVVRVGPGKVTVAHPFKDGGLGEYADAFVKLSGSTAYTPPPPIPLPPTRFGPPGRKPTR